MDDYPAGQVLAFVVAPLLLMIPLWAAIPIVFIGMWILACCDFLGWRFWRRSKT